MSEGHDKQKPVQDEAVPYILEVISSDAEQTQHLGMHLGALLHGGELILLDGQLGAGKTTFTQGLAKGMGISETVSSPTFTLLKEYRRQGTRPVSSGKPALYHFDLYRLEVAEEMLDLGFEDYFYGSGVCVVEWAENAGDLWPLEQLTIRLSMIDEHQRHLLLTATGERYHELLCQFQKYTYVTARS